MTIGDLMLAGISLAIGGIITYFVTRKVSPRPRLTYTLTPVGLIKTNDLGAQYSISNGSRNFDNLIVYSLEIQLSGSVDIPQASVEESPFLDFSGLTLLSIKTKNNDESRFRIPLAISHNNSRLYINIERIRSGTSACFQIVASLAQIDEPPSDASFFPGSILNVDAATKGAIARPWKRDKRRD